MNESILAGRNAVFEALKAGRSIEKIYVQQGAQGGSLLAIIRLAQKNRIQVQQTNRERLDEMSSENHQGVVAVVSAVEYQSVDDMIERARQTGEVPFILICESIQDPHNLGAMIRTAEACGVHGIVISKHHAVGLSDAVAKTAAGALEYLPVAKVSSVAKLVDELKKEGFWVVCADMDGENMYEADLTGPTALVIGGEHEGITRLVKEKADHVIRIPMRGTVNSLNASVAAGILMYEITRQRTNKQAK
ncbi:MAG: 23S rRNA (guanosine(2251)-2'-O)-methyltransferase RlmB [Firmicutes bacterium]|nr:23S rRNA (guanosine(2251)-2'-O)-methyltransferase RlmB [Bacillota bacterium]